MSKGKKNPKRLKYEDRLKAQAENRRKLLASLPKGTADWVRKDFAKLGLFQ